MGSKKVKRAKKLAVKPRDGMRSFFERLRSVIGSPANYFHYLFRKYNRVKQIREKYRHQHRNDYKSLRAVLNEYLRIAVEWLRLPEFIAWVRRQAAKIRLPKIEIIWLRQIKLPRLTIPQLSWPKMPRINLLNLKAIKLPKFTGSKLSELQLPKLHVKIPKIAVPKLPRLVMPKVNLPEFKSLRLPTIKFSWLESLKMHFLNWLKDIQEFFTSLSNVTSGAIHSIDWSKFKPVKLSSFDLSRLKSVKLLTVNVARLKTLSLKNSGAALLQGLNISVPELSWAVLAVERVPSFVPLSLTQKLAGFKMPTLERPTLPVISELSLRRINPAGRGAISLQAAALVLLMLSLSWFPIYDNMPVSAYALQINGQTIAYSTDKAAAEKTVADLKEAKTQMLKRKVDIAGQINFVAVKAKRGQLERTEDLSELLSQKLSFVAVATGIQVNGELAVAVANEEEAQKILKQLKDSYVKEGMQVTEVTFAEEVKLVDVPVSLAEVMSPEDALRLIKEGKQKNTVHIVENGESLWVIARKYDMSVEQLQMANPAIKGEHVDIGQEINLVAIEPLVNVQIAGELTVQETVPYKVKVETDRSLWRGTEKVKIAGENGLREVTYRVVLKNGTIVNQNELKENILKPVTNKVVVRGSKIVVASRGGGGQIGWPISGRITSGYGTRWGRAHTGIDIDGVTGQPIGAAAAGQIVFVGYQGAYGKMITIKHDNGWVTRYGHLSKYQVSVGQRVERGDLIGLVGNTGRSTGSHLHFEVLIDGGFRNPIKYLK